PLSSVWRGLRCRRRCGTRACLATRTPTPIRPLTLCGRRGGGGGGGGGRRWGRRRCGDRRWHRTRGGEAFTRRAQLGRGALASLLRRRRSDVRTRIRVWRVGAQGGHR